MSPFPAPVSEHRYLDALLRNDLLSFSERVFRELHPGKTFVPNWHHEALTYKLDVSAGTGELNRLIVNLPPRSLKSEIASVALPAFLLGRDPTRRIIVVSYNQDLANTFSRQTRQVMRAPWYRRLFPSTALVGQAAIGQFYTTAGGYRVALSVGGTFTGRGGDIIIIDDPMKADEANSPVHRASLAQWAMLTLFSRLDDKLTGVIVLVAQRFHEDDLSGTLARGGGWSVMSVPAIAEENTFYTLGRNPLRRHFRKAGDVLDEQREPRHVLEQLRRDMGNSAFLAQYQQMPVPPDGDVVKIGWFRPYRELPIGGERILSIDTASKAGVRNDWSVAMLWVVIKGRFYLEHVWRRKVEFPELLSAVKDLARLLEPDTILIEDKGHGTGLLQTLREEREGFPATAYDPGSLDKESRMKIQSHKIEGGRVFIPIDKPFVEDFLEEVRRFPGGKHDDQIDAMSQVLDFGSRQVPELIQSTYIS